MAKIKTIVAHNQEGNLWWVNMVLAAVKVEEDMATTEATVVVVLHRVTTMPTITHKCKFSNLAHTFNTHATSKIYTGNRGNYKALTREWTSRESITQETQCHKDKEWTKTAKCCRQFKRQAVVAQMLLIMEDSRWCKIRCIASVGKTTDRCRKIDRKQLERVCLAVERARGKFTNNSMHTAMTEHKHNYNNWMKSNLQIQQCQSKRNQWEKDQQLSVWISSTNKSHDLNHSCRQTVRWTNHQTMWEPVAEVVCCLHRM